MKTKHVERESFLTYYQNPDYLALLGGIIENPFCEARPLIIADWLDEHKAEYRAGFIRKLVREKKWNPDTLVAPFDELDKLYEENPSLPVADWIDYRLGFCQGLQFERLAELFDVLKLVSKVCPIIRYTAQDRRPFIQFVSNKKNGPPEERFTWNQEGYIADVSQIPYGVFQHLKKYRYGSRQAIYQTSTAAHHDLWDALTAYGRFLNNLPDLKRPDGW